jgi:hypothetical protein
MTFRDLSPLTKHDLFATKILFERSEKFLKLFQRRSFRDLMHPTKPNIKLPN